MMNEIGIHYGYWAHDWNTDFVSLIPRAKQLGFDVLELNPAALISMGRTDQDRLRGKAEECAVRLTYCVGLPRQCDVASADRSIRSAGITYLRDQTAMIKRLGGKALSGILYGWWPTSIADGEQEKGACLQRSIESVREVMKSVEDLDVTFNLEVVNRYEQFMLNTAQEAVEYVERIGSSHCKILLDTFHMNIEEDSFDRAIALVGDKLGHFHLGETNRRPPGTGRIPWDEVIGALHRIGYSGAVVMEPFLMPGGDIGRDIRVYRDLLGPGDLDNEARKACLFIKSQLAAFV